VQNEVGSLDLHIGVHLLIVMDGSYVHCIKLASTSIIVDLFDTM